MRRILVTAVSGDIANNILKILKENGDCALFGTDVNPIAVGMDQVEEFIRVPYAVDSSYIDAMLKLCHRLGITHLIPTNEREVEAIGNSKQVFADAGIKVLVQNKDLLDICLDKYKTACFLEDKGILVPRTYLSIDEIFDATSFVCKGRKSNGSREVKFFENADEYIEKKYNLDGVVFQEYIEGDEYTVGVFGHNGIYSQIEFKRQLEDGHSCIVELVKSKRLEDISQKVAEALNLEGYINIQLREKDGQFYIFEINPRISGTVAFRHTLGFDDVIWWLDMLDGRLDWRGYECQYKEAVGIREMCHKFLKLEK